LIMKVF